MKFIDEDIKSYQYMYIISNDKGYIKVGISKNPKRRLKQLQTGNQNKLTLLFTEEFECERNHLLKIEKLVHKDLKSFKSDSVGEWFKINTSDLNKVKNIITWNRIRYDSDPLAFKFK